MNLRTYAMAAAMTAAAPIGALAQETCGGNYTVQRGDSLSLIADELYKDVGQWTVIYRSNIDRISSPDSIRVGATYRIPCVNGLPRGLPGGQVLADQQTTPVARVAAPAVVSSDTLADRRRAAAEREAGVDVRLLAGDDFRPFTNRLLRNSGMVSEIVNRAFIANDDTGQHAFYWVNDRSAHLEPMLSEGMADVAFPWTKPDCTGAAAGTTLCTDYVYSDLMFEMLVVLFTARGSSVQYTGEADLAGMRVCSPLGHNAGGRSGQASGYLQRAGARLQQPATSEECFQRLARGSVDAVAMNEFTGRGILRDLGMSDAVELQLGRPLAIEGLHAVAHRNNPRAEALIAALDDGLAQMRDSGEYLAIIDKHMSSIWAGL